MVSSRRLRRLRGRIIATLCGPARGAVKPLAALQSRARPGTSATRDRMNGQSRMQTRETRRTRLRMAAVAAALLALPVAGCGSGMFGETFQKGYVVPDGALEQIPIGASQEQVLIVLGTPSTVATVNGEAFYYISQKTERSAAFMPYAVTDQRVVAVYFDKNRRVRPLANYGIKDGTVFGF